MITLEIQHPTFRDDNNNPTSIFIVNDFTSLMATLEADAPIKPGEVVEFLPLQFKFTRPEESSSAAPPMTISLPSEPARSMTRSTVS